MTTVINSTTPIASGALSFEDIESDMRHNKTSSDWYYVKNKKTEPQTSVAPQPQIKFKSAKKSPSMSSINMAPSTTLTFPNGKLPTTNSNTKHEKINSKTKETTHNDYFTCPLNGDSAIYGRMGVPNEHYAAHYTLPDLDTTFSQNFRQSQENGKDIASRGMSPQQQQQQYYHHHQQQQNLSDRMDNVVSLETKLPICQKQTHPPDINSTNTNCKSQQKHMQIEKFQNFDKHKFSPYFSGLSHNNVEVTASGLGSSNPSHVGRIQQPFRESSPLMAYRRTMKFIQKRCDETSCGSSFEQLNIIGIPTTTVLSSACSSQKHVTTKTQSSSSFSNNAINKSERQTASNYDVKYGMSSMERMKYSSEPKNRRPLPKLPIGTLVS